MIFVYFFVSNGTEDGKLTDKQTVVGKNEKKMDRDLDITKFSYISYRKLKKQLGEFDAVVECNEIAIREFLKGLEISENKVRYIQRLSDKHNVKVDELDIRHFSNRIRQYYILSVCQQFEQFLKDFKIEFISYFEGEISWEAKKDGEIFLDVVLKNVFKNRGVSPKIISKDLLLVYKYYRLVRNFVSHTDRDKKQIYTIYSRIQGNENIFLEELNIEVEPNSLFDINFDDFKIFTNIVKHLAYSISVESKPNNDRVAQIILEFKKEEMGNFQGIKKLKGNNDRYINAIKKMVSSSFGRFSESDMNEIVEEIKSLLA